MKQISSILKTKREERKITIDTVVRDTRIPKKFVVAIENGTIEEFPAEVYLIGSIKRYAVYLGVDPAQLMSIYYAEKDPAAATVAPKKVCATNSSLLWRIGMAGVALLALGAGIATWIYNSATSCTAVQSPVTAVVTTAPVMQPSTTTAAVAVIPSVHRSTATPMAQVQRPAAAVPVVSATSPAPAVQVPSQTVEGKLILSATTVDVTWVQVVADDKIIYDGVLPAQTVKEWGAAGKIRVRVGYVPGIRLKLNGRDIDATKGARQDVNDLTFTEETLKQG